MRHFHFSLLLSVALLGHAWAQAQTTPAKAPAIEARAKKTTKPKHKKAIDDPVVQPVAAATDLTPELQAIADQIHTGRMPCELGQSVTLLRDSKEVGRFNLFIKDQVYHLTPVQSATGAIRLEDGAKGAVWIQLSDKSMLMNTKIGQRMADMCQSRAQNQVAQAQKLAPPPGLFETQPGDGLAQT
jgi:hypothetical protein